MVKGGGGAVHWCGCVSGEFWGDDGERIKFYRHALHIILQLSTNAYQDDSTLSKGKILMVTESCFMTLVSLSD